MSVPSRESEQVCMCVLGLSVVPLSTIFPTMWHLLFLELSRQWGIFCFWNCPDSVASFIFHFNANACYLSGYSGFPHKTDHHDITEILLKVALNTITLTPNPMLSTLTYVYNSVIDMI